MHAKTPKEKKKNYTTSMLKLQFNYIIIAIIYNL